MISQAIRISEEAKKRVLDTLDFMEKHPETGYKEYKCAEYCERQFRDLGYEPTLAGDIPGFYVKIDTGREGPCVLILGELDAIKCATHPNADPETHAVHACGHSAQMAALVGIAAGLKEEDALDGLSGSIILCAVPAEEMIERDFRDSLIEKGVIKYYGGKAEFLRRGYFDGVDVAFMVHTSSASAPSCRKGSVGIVSKKIVYKGKAAHAGGAPENGINALYAANLGLMAINSIRETFTERELVRVHPIITNGGTVVNGIPDVVEIESYVRARDYDAIRRANVKVNRAICGAALSIGANVEIFDSPGYSPLNNDDNMIALAKRAADMVYDKPLDYRDTYSTGSTDMGDLSMIYPAIHPYAPGAIGTSHGDDYYVASPDLACTKSAEWQLTMLSILLSDGAAEARRIKAEFVPCFSSKEKLLEALDAFSSSGERIVYSDGKAEIKL